MISGYYFINTISNENHTIQLLTITFLRLKNFLAKKKKNMERLVFIPQKNRNVYIEYCFVIDALKNKFN